MTKDGIVSDYNPPLRGLDKCGFIPQMALDSALASIGRAPPPRLARDNVGEIPKPTSGPTAKPQPQRPHRPEGYDDETSELQQILGLLTTQDIMNALRKRGASEEQIARAGELLSELGGGEPEEEEDPDGPVVRDPAMDAAFVRRFGPNATRLKVSLGGERLPPPRVTGDTADLVRQFGPNAGRLKTCY